MHELYACRTYLNARFIQQKTPISLEITGVYKAVKGEEATLTLQLFYGINFNKFVFIRKAIIPTIPIIRPRIKVENQYCFEFQNIHSWPGVDSVVFTVFVASISIGFLSTVAFKVSITRVCFFIES